MAGLVLENGSLAEPSAGPDAGKRDGLAGPRHRAELDEAGSDAGPGVEPVAAMANIGALRKRPLHDPSSRLLEFLVVQVTRPERDAAQSIRCDHVQFPRWRATPVLRSRQDSIANKQIGREPGVRYILEGQQAQNQQFRAGELPSGHGELVVANGSWRTLGES